MSVKNKTYAPPGSLDMIRIIRQSNRCFVYGALGVLPWVGLGLAVQALRLRRRVAMETGEPWELPPVWTYWALGLIVVCISDRLLGGVTAITVFILVAALQSFHLWWSFPAEPGETSESRAFVASHTPVAAPHESATDLSDEKCGALTSRRHSTTPFVRPEDPLRIWNPGRYHLLWGAILACAGLYASFAPLAAITVRLGNMKWQL